MNLAKNSKVLELDESLLDVGNRIIRSGQDSMDQMMGSTLTVKAMGDQMIRWPCFNMDRMNR